MRHKDRQTKQPDKIEKGEKEILSSAHRILITGYGFDYLFIIFTSILMES